MTSPQVLIDRYFKLALQADDAYFAQFADDAVVEDEGHTHHGATAIRAWRTSVPPVTYTVRDVTSAGTGHDVDAEVAGDFPGSPVTLHFHFEFTAGDQIAVLTIRP